MPVRLWQWNDLQFLRGILPPPPGPLDRPRQTLDINAEVSSARKSFLGFPAGDYEMALRMKGVPGRQSQVRLCIGGMSEKSYGRALPRELAEATFAPSRADYVWARLPFSIPKELSRGRVTVSLSATPPGEGVWIQRAELRRLR